MVKIELPDRISHGFLSVEGLQGMGLGKVRCYQHEEFHTGFTLFSPDEQTSVYVQMYGLPDGEEKLAKDVAFQAGDKGWGKSPTAAFLALTVFPRDWTHAATASSPKRMVHLYQGPRRAVFIRYVGKSLKDPLFAAFNAGLRYLPEDWHLELNNRELVPSLAPSVPAPAAMVEVINLDVEQAAVRKMLLEGIAQFAKEQRAAGADAEGVPATRVVVFFDVGNGHASMNVDVRSPYPMDGAYSHGEWAAMPREHWRQFIERFYEGKPVLLKGVDGTATTIGPGTEFDFDAAFGGMIVDVVKSLQKEKAFAPLRIADGAELFIEAHDATFVWPDKAERKRGENRL